VAEAALSLAKVDPGNVILRFLRATPAVASYMDVIDARRQYDTLRGGGVRSVEAQDLVARRFSVSTRTVRRWLVMQLGQFR
jgi:hypothetical protein